MKPKGSKTPGNSSLLFRYFVCRSIDAVLDLAIGHAVAQQDFDLQASLERVDAILDHEMKSFLGLREGTARKR